MLRTRRRRASDDENEGRCLNVWEEVFITTTIYVSWFWTALHRGVNNSNSRETRISSIITITNHLHIWVLSIFLRKRKLVSQLVNPGWIRKRRIHMTQCHCITQYFHTLDSNKMNKFFTEVLISHYCLFTKAVKLGYGYDMSVYWKCERIKFLHRTPSQSRDSCNYEDINQLLDSDQAIIMCTSFRKKWQMFIDTLIWVKQHY